MVSPKHIKIIDEQLQKFGSKVSDTCLDGEEHALANVLWLACGESTYGISLEKINSIRNANFQLDVKN